MRAKTTLFRAWGVYYVLTGLWPIMHMPTFEAVTGPKIDDWLVHMVGLLAAAIGLTLLRGASRPDKDLAFLAVVSAVAFAAIDLWYAFTRVISFVYVADAAIELLLVAILAATFSGERRAQGGHDEELDPPDP